MDKLKLLGCLLLSAATVLWAQKPVEIEEEIKVIGSKSETPRDEFGSTVHIVTEQDIERRQWRTLSQVLRNTPGVAIAQTGSDGGVATLFLRGAKAEDVLVLLNGVKLNDAAGIGRGYDFAHLSTTGIERIEIMAGPQSVLYGSDASAGVVNIIMKEGAKPSFSAMIETADEDYSGASIGISDRKGMFRYAAEFGYSDSKSISARSDGFGSALEKDGYTNLNGHVRLGFDLGSDRSLGLGLHFTDADSDFDATSGDDPNFTGDYRQTAFNLGYEARPNGLWGYGLFLTHSQTDRTNRDGKDLFHPSDALDSDFQGVNLGAEFRNSIDFNDKTRLIAGLSFDREEAEGVTTGESAYGPFSSAFSRDADLIAVYSQLRFSMDSGFHAALGGRYDDHNQFGGHGTYQGSLGYTFKQSGTRLRAYYGTGFHAPSIFQLYGDSGNPSLKEETNQSIEFGAAQDFLEGKIRLSAVWFDNDYKDLIDFFFDPNTYVGTYINIDRVKTRGYELSAAFRGKYLGIALSYEDLDADEIIPGPAAGGPAFKAPLVRRYDQKASLLTNGAIGRHFDWTLDLLYFGETLDIDFNNFDSGTGAFARARLDDYILVNLTLAYRLGERFTIHARAENLTDEDYVQVIGYNTHGRRIFLGLKFRR